MLSAAVVGMMLVFSPIPITCDEACMERQATIERLECQAMDMNADHCIDYIGAARR